MKRARSSEEEANMESKLPEAIVHHIFSFLSPKDAAKASLVQKSWLRAWYTRTSLYFDEFSVRDPLLARNFPNFITNTLERYANEDLSIQEFTLYTRISRSASLAQQWIQMVTTRSVKVVRLEFSGGPPAVSPLALSILESELLEKLKICWVCHLYPRNCVSRFIGRILCSSLRVLSVKRVDTDEETLPMILSCCPLLATLKLSDLTLSSCRLGFSPSLKDLTLRRLNMKSYRDFFDNLNRQFPCLVNLRVTSCDLDDPVNISCPSLKILCFVDCRIDNLVILSSPSLLNLTVLNLLRLEHSCRLGGFLPSLKDLTLDGLKMKAPSDFLDNLKHQYPCLENLRVISCDLDDPVNISMSREP